MKQRKHVVIGNGVLGQAVAQRLIAEGVRPTVLSRHGAASADWDACACDVSDSRQLISHLLAPTTLYVCVAPAYWRWPQEFPKITEGIVTACAGREVDIVLADNLYAYGASAAPFTEGQPYRPCSRKGEVRRRVAEDLMALHAQGSLRAMLVRSADFFGPGVVNSSVGKAVVHSAMTGKAAYLLGNPDLPHAITYLPDFAHTLVELAKHDKAFGKCWHAPSHNLSSLRSLVDDIARRSGKPARIKTLGPTLIRVMGVFSPAMRELREMLYLFEQPCAIASNTTAAEFQLPLTRLDEAIDSTVKALATA